MFDRHEKTCYSPAEMRGLGPRAGRRASVPRDARKLSDRQQRILEFIRQSIRERGYPPSIREIGEAAGLKSTSTVHGHLNRLERRGYLRRDPAKPRTIELTDREDSALRHTVSVPVVGRVTAGAPILATENVEQVYSLPEDLVGEGPAFLLRVQGDSMRYAGILDGDLVIVHQQDTADNGDIVVALLEDEATVKRYFVEEDHIRLQPENPAYAPIRAREVKILGKVVGLIRRF